MRTKRVGLILVALIATLIPIGLTAAPASATTWCDTPQFDQRTPQDKLPQQGVVEVDRYSFGTYYWPRDVEPDGSLGFIDLNSDIDVPLVSAWQTPADCFGFRFGGWGVTPWGQVVADGTYAGHYGDMNGVPLNRPVVGMAPTATGNGYWLVAGDGGMFSFGDAPFYGSTGGIHLNKPIVAMAAAPTGSGYLLAASDGGIFTFGDAPFYGSMGGTPLNKPVVGMVPTPSGHGYWMVASDGGIFTFGDATFKGSLGGAHLGSPIVGMIPNATGGYTLVSEDGTIHPFG